MSGWTGWQSAPRWFCLAIGLFLLVRATTTLAAGASWDLPGDGWRSAWQIAVVVVLAAGVIRPRWAVPTVVLTAAIYAAATILELFDGTQLLMTIPVDMRDRLVHPLIAIVALICAWTALRTDRRRSVTPLP